jgi:hypothetical protein
MCDEKYDIIKTCILCKSIVGYIHAQSSFSFFIDLLNFRPGPLAWGLFVGGIV